jgi:hypothetical protein
LPCHRREPDEAFGFNRIAEPPPGFQVHDGIDIRENKTFVNRNHPSLKGN